MKKIIAALYVSLFMYTGVATAQIVHGSTYSSSTTYTSRIKPSTHYEGELNIGFATGGKLKDADGDKEKTNYSRPFISTIHGVRINEYGFVGLGAGVQYAYGEVWPDDEDSDNWNTLMIPVFLNLKGYYPLSADFAPYISVSFGGSICATSDLNDSYEGEDSKLKGGFYSEYGIGFNYKRLNFGFGLQHQSMKFSYSSRGDEESFKNSVNSFFVKVGLKF